MPLSERVYCVAVTFKMTEESNESASNFVLSLNVPPWKLFRWFRSCSYGLLVIGSFIMTMHLLMHHVLCSLAKHQITQVTQPPYSPDLVPCDFWLFPKLKSPLKGKRFQTMHEFRKIWLGSWWWLGELCEVPRCLLWRGLRHHCPMYNASCILYLLQYVSIFHINGWIPSGQTLNLSQKQIREQYTAMYHLMTRIHSEKFVVRWFWEHHRCNYTNLHSIAYCTPNKTTQD